MGLRRCLQTLATAQKHKASLVTSQATAASHQRMMTTTTAMNPFASATEQLSPAVSKFVHVLEEYRKENYGQTLYSRYVKQMVSAMDANGDGKISRQELRSLLENIGAMSQQPPNQSAMLTDDDLQAVIDELGEESTTVTSAGSEQVAKEIHVESVQDLILSAYLKNNEDA